MASTILPLELVDKAIGSKIWVIMKTNREFVGTLLGFDDYVSEWLPCSSLMWFIANGSSGRHGSRRRDRIVRSEI